MGPLVDDFDLVPQRGGIFLLIDLAMRAHGLDALLLDLHNLLFRGFQLRRLPPDLAPVAVTDAGRVAGADGVEHPFGGIGVGGTVGAVAAEVVEQNVGIFADVAEVDAFAAFLQEEEAVEVFEEGRVRLVDGAEDALAGGGELAEESNDVEGGLGVETGGGLVEEEEEFGFGG